MNAIPEQYVDESKKFRAYMRTRKGEKGQFLSNLMDGAEVHYIIPISSTDGEHEIDSIKDLIPVCSNCHSILHRRRPEPYLPEDVRLMIKAHK